MVAFLGTSATSLSLRQELARIHIYPSSGLPSLPSYLISP